MKSEKLKILFLVAILSISTASCGALKKEIKTEPTRPLSAVLKAGEPAPFTGILVEAEHFSELMIAATRMCEQ